MDGVVSGDASWQFVSGEGWLESTVGYGIWDMALCVLDFFRYRGNMERLKSEASHSVTRAFGVDVSLLDGDGVTRGGDSRSPRRTILYSVRRTP